MKQRIEVYQVAEGVAAVRAHHFLPAEDDWFVDWLIGLRLEAAAEQLSFKLQVVTYLAATGVERRMAFSNVLAKTLRESTRAPLVIFRLYPLALELAVVQAFGDRTSALAVRRRQGEILSSLHDCPECRGTILDCGDQCRQCGNPLWTIEYLLAAD